MQLESSLALASVGGRQALTDMRRFMFVVWAVGASTLTQAQPGPGGPAMGPGTCSAPDTQIALRQVVIDAIGSSPFFADRESRQVAEAALGEGAAPLSLVAIRTVSRDRTVGRSSCGAKLRISMSPAVFNRLAGNVGYAAMIGAAGWRRDGNADAATAEISFISQLTDDRKSVYVELKDATRVAQGAGLLAVAVSETAQDAAKARTTGATASTPGTK